MRGRTRAILCMFTLCAFEAYPPIKDLQELFKIGDQCPETNYLFLGDFVDRGFYSVETFLLLLALKVRRFRCSRNLCPFLVFQTLISDFSL